MTALSVVHRALNSKSEALAPGPIRGWGSSSGSGSTSGSGTLVP